MTQFVRYNYGFYPMIRQTADVVFTTEVPWDEFHVQEFEDRAWEAMWAQNPQWKNYEGPIAGSMGWSSVFQVTGYKEVVCK
jgi:hypothetical protein